MEEQLISKKRIAGRNINLIRATVPLETEKFNS